VDGESYVAALRDWVSKGSESQYVLSPEEIQKRIKQKYSAAGFNDQADACFQLGAHFQIKGDHERAGKYFDKAQSLNPDSWNYHRQDWSFLPSMGNTMKNFNARVDASAKEGKPYYAPNDLSNPDAEENVQEYLEKQRK
jgi:tetratricopeptide (TPR) repeat protein